MGQKRPLPGKKEAAAERRITALELRKAGATYQAIGKKLGISEGQAHKDVAYMLNKLSEQERAVATDLRQLQLERLDTALFAIANQVRQGHLGAIDRMLKIEERRAKLLGLDAPAKVASEVKAEVAQTVAIAGVDYSNMSAEELMVLYKDAVKG